MGADEAPGQNGGLMPELDEAFFPDEDDEDDLIDSMARFVEGNDLELIKDHSSSI